MPLETCSLAQGIPPKLHQPAMKKPHSKKTTAKTKKNCVCKQKPVSSSDDDSKEKESSSESESPPKKRHKKQPAHQTELDAEVEEVDDEATEKIVEVVDDSDD